MASEDFEIDLGQEEQLIKDVQELEEQQALTTQSCGGLVKNGPNQQNSGENAPNAEYIEILKGPRIKRYKRDKRSLSYHLIKTSV
ncbi:hypothetical protein MMC34_008676 [Xylographa carneopallida]|nr:hypothetical protein [Xylographa carneopallida]